MRYLLQAKRSFLADDMGLGKTVTALAATQHSGAFPLTVVCKNKDSICSQAVLDLAEQVPYRLCRSGQADPVTCHYVLGRGTIDEGMWQLLEEKSESLRALAGSGGEAETVDLSFLWQLAE